MHATTPDRQAGDVRQVLGEDHLLEVTRAKDVVTGGRLPPRDVHRERQGSEREALEAHVHGAEHHGVPLVVDRLGLEGQQVEARDVAGRAGIEEQAEHGPVRGGAEAARARAGIALPGEVEALGDAQQLGAEVVAEVVEPGDGDADVLAGVGAAPQIRTSRQGRPPLEGELVIELEAQHADLVGPHQRPVRQPHRTDVRLDAQLRGGAGRGAAREAPVLVGGVDPGIDGEAHGRRARVVAAAAAGADLGGQPPVPGGRPVRAEEELAELRELGTTHAVAVRRGR